MYAKGTQIEIELQYNTGVTERITMDLQKTMSTSEMFSNIEYIFKEIFPLKKYRISVADRWSQWHYVA